MRASTVGTGTIWVGTNNGLIKVTHDAGKTWSDASIPEFRTCSAPKCSASSRRTSTPPKRTPCSDLYRSATTRRTSSARATRAIVDAHRRGPRDEPAERELRARRAERPVRRGLLFAGTESDMYVSFDDGDHWQSLQLDLPTTSYRDIALKDNDIVVSTYGRGFWALDDYSMLRQVSSSVVSEAAHLFKPGDVVAYAPQRRRRHAVPARGAARAQPRPRRTTGLLARTGAARRHHPRRARRVRRARATHVECGDHARDRSRAPARAELLDRDAQAAPDERRRQPHELGSALRFAELVHALVRDQREPGAHAGVAGRTGGASRARTRSSSRSTGRATRRPWRSSPTRTRRRRSRRSPHSTRCR